MPLSREKPSDLCAHNPGAVFTKPDYPSCVTAKTGAIHRGIRGE
jgi:hypothetical protein